MESLNQTEAMNTAIKLSQAYADLHDNFLVLAASRAVLDNMSQHHTDDARVLALDAVRFVRRMCDGLITTITELTPATSAETLLRTQVLTVYLAPPDGDELLLSMFIESPPQRPFPKTRTRKIRPRPNHHPQPTVLDCDWSTSGQPALSL